MKHQLRRTFGVSLAVLALAGGRSLVAQQRLPVEASPAGFSLEQNYPNPFNPLTRIQFSIPKDGFAQLVIYDVLGREVHRLINNYVKAGNHLVLWDGKNMFGELVGAGMYFYQLKAGEFRQTRKMVLLK